MRITNAFLYSGLCSILIGFFCSPCLAENASPGSSSSASGTHSTRISRPGKTEIDSSSSSVNFKSMALGLSTRWWRKFKNPSFCPYVLCGSSCSDISGIPRVGSYSIEELLSEQTPCGLVELNALVKPESCCMSGTINSSYKGTCSDAECCSSNAKSD